MAKHPAKCPRCGNRLEFDTAVDEHIVCPGCQQLLSLPGKFKLSDKVDPLLGQRLGQYEILELLGRGGMGAVYQARQPSLDRSVAVKVLPRNLLRDASFVERFQREARDAAAVVHPNIIPIYDVGQDKGYQFIAMEYVEGESLADLLKREGPLPADRALDLLKQVAAALAAAHAKGIVHRDIKPANILLTVQGHAKVADFGLAKRSATDVSVTQTGVMMGTPLYFPPEAARGERYDARSDLYSLGATFYHLIAGHPPFEGGNAIELAMKHAERTPPPLKQLVPATPIALCEIVHRLLRKKAEDRFQTAEDLLDALDRAQASVGATHGVAPGRGSASPLRPGDRAPGADEPTLRMPSALRPSPGHAAPGGEAAHVALADRRQAKARTRRKLLLGAVAALLVLVVVLLVVVGHSSSSRPQATTPPPSFSGTPTPTTQHPTPSPLPPKTDNRQPKTTPQPAAPAAPWDAAWKETESKAKTLAQENRFGDAAKLYEGLAGLFDDFRLKDRAQKAVAALHEQADTAYAELETKAKGLAAQKKFEEARTALRPVLDRFGLPLKIEAAKKLLAEIEAAEKTGETAKVAKDAKKEEEKGKEIDKAEVERRESEAKKRQGAEAAFAKAMEPIEALVAAWDFSAASELLPKVPNLREVTERLSTRRDELERLGKLHAKLIDKINKTQPPLKRGSLYIPGPNADLVAADEKSITAKLPDGKTESHPWPGLSPKVIQNLVLRAIDRESADDWLAAGLLALAQSGMARVDGTVGATHRVASGVGATHGVAQGEAVPRPYSAEAVTSAEAAFERARALGASIDRYLDPLAAGAFAQAQGFLEAKKHAEAKAALATLEKKYAATPWLAAHKADLASARDAARAGIAESEAEKLYGDAAKLFEKKELFDLKPLIEKLKTTYPATKPVTDATRKPTFAEMLKATETLGKFITVRQDGKGDFKSIQAAIDAAQANSLIEIQDSGSYNEKIEVGTEGLVLRGKRGCWPVITSLGSRRNFPCLLLATAPRVTIERLVLYHGAPGGGEGVYLNMQGERSKLRFVIACTPGDPRLSCYITNSEVSNCVLGGFLARVGGGTLVTDTLIGSYLAIAEGSARLMNVVVWSSNGLTMGTGCEARSCSVLGRVAFEGEMGVIEDSIAPTIYSPKPGVRIERCDAFGIPPYEDLAKPGKGCFSADPQFRDPANFDYRLKPTSPCRKKASDGGDLGCRYTPEMMEVLEKALELRRKGIIKF